MRPARRPRAGVTAALLLMGLGIAGQAGAAGCSVSAPALAFGAYEPLTLPGQLSSAVVSSNASVAIACTGIDQTRGYTIALGPSLAGSGNRISIRYLSNGAGGADMAFNVYREPAFATIWGDGTTAGSVLSGTVPPGDSNQSVTVYGMIPAGQNTLRAGAFSGSMTMTLTVSP